MSRLLTICIDLPSVGLVAICGKSGSGKTTLVNCLSGIEQVDSGTITVDNNQLGKMTPDKLDEYRNHTIGIIFQDYNLIEQLTVEQNIGLSFELQGKPLDKQKIEQILTQVGLEGYGKRKTVELSGGEQQRVAIARTIAKNTQIILADEPTGNLDEDTGG